MNKPSYTAIKTYSPDKPVLIFVSSRRQTRLTAFDLVAYVAAEDDTKQWLHIPDQQVCVCVIVTYILCLCKSMEILVPFSLAIIIL